MWKKTFCEKVWILDGAFSTELEKSGFSFLNDPLWTARVLHTHPDAVVQLHKNFLKSGADIITTGSYQASILGFQTHLGLSLEESENLIKSSVELAKKARSEYLSSISDPKVILVAGSVGPYGAALADGSEYNGQYCDKMSHEELIEWHRPRIQCLLDAGVDVLALETIPAVKEAEALLKLLREFPDCKAWLSFSCQSKHQNSKGEDIAEAAKQCLKIAPAAQLLAIGVNCCPPEYADSLLIDINSVASGWPLIVYPNSGEIWNSKIGWTGQRTIQDNFHLDAWINTSAKVIGGCCRTTSEDIRAFQTLS